MRGRDAGSRVGRRVGRAAQETRKTMNTSLRILYILGGLPFGGVETWQLAIAKELRERGHVPVIVNLSGTGVMEEEYHTAGFTPLHVGNNVASLKTSCLGTTLKLRRLIRETRPDLIHTSHFSANYHGRLAAIGLGIPVVVHCHNIKRERKASRRLADSLLSFATHTYIAVARAVAEQGVRPYNWAGRPCKVQYNAIDHNLLRGVAPQELLPGGGPALVSVCRLVRQKNMDILLRAFALCLGRLPDLRLLIVGDGPEIENLRRLARELGVEEKAFFPGFRSDVPGIMCAVAQRPCLFVMPSAYEGFGIAPLEGFYFGIPALVSPAVPLREIAGDAAQVCPAEAGPMAEAIGRILSDQEAWRTMSQSAQAVAERFSIKDHVTALLKIYEGVLP